VTSNIDFGNATHGHPQIEIPSWIPDEVKECIRNRIEPIAFLTAADHEAARRLANDPLMESVWHRPELKNRPGLDRLFWFVWTAALDGLRETTQNENELQHKLAQHEIAILRVVAARMEKEDANEFLRLARVDGGILSLPGEIRAKQLIRDHQIAVIRKVAADRAAELTFLRGPDDPLTRSYGRDTTNKVPSTKNDTSALGLGKTIAAFLRENFVKTMPQSANKPNAPVAMYGTAWKLMIVALGLDPDKAPTKSAIRVAVEKDRCA
jgi:hypothetical protein